MSYIKNMPHAYASDDTGGTSLSVPAAASWTDTVKNLPKHQIALGALAAGALASAAFAVSAYLTPAKSPRRKASTRRAGGAKRRTAAAA